MGFVIGILLGIGFYVVTELVHLDDGQYFAMLGCFLTAYLVGLFMGSEY